MQNSIVKNVLACLVLSILCFGLGSSVADSYITSAGILIVLIGAVSMLLVGTRSWMLLFLLPPLMEFLPLTGQMAHVPKGFFVAPMVMGYWLLLWILGYYNPRIYYKAQMRFSEFSFAANAVYPRVH